MLQSYRVFIVASHHLNSGVIYYVNKVFNQMLKNVKNYLISMECFLFGECSSKLVKSSTKFESLVRQAAKNNAGHN